MLYGQIKIAVQTYEESPLWKRPVSGILGRAFSPLYGLMMANEDFMKSGPGKADLDTVKQYYSRDDIDKKNDISISLGQACKQVGVSKATLSRLEKGNAPDIVTFAIVCAWLDKPMTLFFNKK